MSESGAIEHLAGEGFTDHFAVEGQSLRDLDSGEAFRPDELIIRCFVRFEGVSDPDDMSIVYAIESHGGTRGTLIDAFGVYSNPAIGDFVDAIPGSESEIDPHLSIGGPDMAPSSHGGPEMAPNPPDVRRAPAEPGRSSGMRE